MAEERKLKESQKLAEQKVKEARRREREERRRKRKKQLASAVDEDEAFAKKIAVEEAKLLVAQRKLESIRLLDELFERVKVMIMMMSGQMPQLTVLHLFLLPTTQLIAMRLSANSL